MRLPMPQLLAHRRTFLLQAVVPMTIICTLTKHEGLNNALQRGSGERFGWNFDQNGTHIVNPRSSWSIGLEFGLQRCVTSVCI